MPAGRPTTYDATLCEEVVKLGAEGKSQVQISASIDIPRTTMLSWAEKQPEFATALARAKDLEQVWWEDVAQANLGNGKFNAQLWMKNVASRFRAVYGEKLAIGGDGSGIPIQTEDASARDIAKAVLALLGKAVPE